MFFKLTLHIALPGEPDGDGGFGGKNNVRGFSVFVLFPVRCLLDEKIKICTNYPRQWVIKFRHFFKFRLRVTYRVEKKRYSMVS